MKSTESAINTVFEEEQNFRQWWLVVLLAVIFLTSLWFVIHSSYSQLYLGNRGQWGC